MFFFLLTPYLHIPTQRQYSGNHTPKVQVLTARFTKVGYPKYLPT